MADIAFHTVGIVGFGLMGGSLAKDLRKLDRPPHIRAISQDRPELEAGLAEGVLDLAPGDPETFFEALDLVVYATPLGATLHLLLDHEKHVGAGTLVTDLVSLKHPVLEGMKAAGLVGRYVGSHPMAGREGRGFSKSVEGLFRDARVWLVSEGASESSQRRVSALWESLGAHPSFTQAKAHDERMAWLSHLPQLAGTALGRVLGEAGFSREELGTGGKDMTRLAGSAPEMWEDLFRVAPEELPGALEALERALADLRELVTSKDAHGVAEIMNETRRWYRGRMELRVPGDKSISQRGLILAALSSGQNRLRGLLSEGDPASTAEALRGLGVAIPELSGPGSELTFPGLGLRGLRTPQGTLDLGNSGTGARLLLGVLAGQPLTAVLTGDESLRARPMARITRPLTAMGSRFQALEREGCLPIRVFGSPLRDFSYELPVASAQLKSALLLAGLVGGVEVRLLEPGRSRDHTERMLAGLGVDVQSGPQGGDWRVTLTKAPEALPPQDLEIPGDFSSGAFFLLLGLLQRCPEPLVIRGVGLNETRTGLLPVLERMGGRFSVEDSNSPGRGERWGDIVVDGSELKGCEVGAEEIPGLIDEIPILAAGAARAVGTTKITGAAELRVKETDRIKALADNLRALGVEVEELQDGLEIQGSDRPLKGRVHSFGDHRIAMAFGVLGALPGNQIEVEGAEVAGVSFPGFWELLRRVREFCTPGGPGQYPTGSAPGEPAVLRGSRPPVVTLDGPAGSGKSTTAREVARRLGFRHLDSGALYRALTFALLSAGIPEEEWPALTVQELDRFRIWLRPAGPRFHVLLGDQVLEGELRTPEVTARVSPLSALPAVRAWLLEAQRRAGQEGALVADGRDMGTVVFPDAEVKIFLTANLEERAHRRFLERTGDLPTGEQLQEEAGRIQERDTRDSGREVAPLRKAADALEVDTSDLSFEAQVRVIIDHVKGLTEK